MSFYHTHHSNSIIFLLIDTSNTKNDRPAKYAERSRNCHIKRPYTVGNGATKKPQHSLRLFLVHHRGLEPRTHWLRVSCSPKWLKLSLSSKSFKPLLLHYHRCSMSNSICSYSNLHFLSSPIPHQSRTPFTNYDSSMPTIHGLNHLLRLVP